MTKKRIFLTSYYYFFLLPSIVIDYDSHNNRFSKQYLYCQSPEQSVDIENQYNISFSLRLILFF